jgi:hypothetical protein
MLHKFFGVNICFSIILWTILFGTPAYIIPAVYEYKGYTWPTFTKIKYSHYFTLDIDSLRPRFFVK